MEGAPIFTLEKVTTRLILGILTAYLDHWQAQLHVVLVVEYGAQAGGRT